MTRQRNAKRKRSRRSTGGQVSDSDWSDHDFTDNLIEALKDEDVQTSLRQCLFADAPKDKLTSDSVKKYRIECENRLLELERRCERLERANDELEQYGRRWSVRISGIRERLDENTDDLVLDVARQMGLNLCPSDINRSHRVGKRNGQGPRDIIVKFVRHNDKYEFYWARFKLRPPIYVREDLTRKRNHLFFLARQAKKNDLIAKTWTNDGSIYVETKNNVVRKVLDGTDLSKIIPTSEATHMEETSPEQTQNNSGTPYVPPKGNRAGTSQNAPVSNPLSGKNQKKPTATTSKPKPEKSSQIQKQPVATSSPPPRFERQKVQTRLNFDSAPVTQPVIGDVKATRPADQGDGTMQSSTADTNPPAPDGKENTPIN